MEEAREKMLSKYKELRNDNNECVEGTNRRLNCSSLIMKPLTKCNNWQLNQSGS